MKILSLLISLILLILVSCIKEKKTKIVEYNLERAISLYDSTEYKESLFILDSLLKRDTFSNKEHLLFVLNNIKLNKLDEAKQSILKCENHEEFFEKNPYYDVLKKIKIELDYAQRTNDIFSITILADIIYGMIDSVELINKVMETDSSKVYTIEIPQ
ncbi:MAG: hypothetical protein GQ564_12945 [Bacteroidales bacterium]|nr:hypothetical protein [Bacteroidales bacterium]